MDKEFIEITLNYEGEDYKAICDMQTANILLNDPDEARKFVENHIIDLSKDQPSNSRDLDDFNYAETSNEETADEQKSADGEETDEQPLWSNKSKCVERDVEGTAAFLKLREKYDKKFNDKKTAKVQLWKLIATELEHQGFKIKGNREGAEKCRQKFANMQKIYLKHIEHMKTTGSQKKDPPPFFQEMHGILGVKHKTNPQNLQDTESQNDEENAEPVAGPSNEIKSRFSRVKKSVRPKSTSEEIIKILKEEQIEKKQQYEKLEALLLQQNQQRERFLDILETMSKKRKRGDSDSD